MKSFAVITARLFASALVTTGLSACALFPSSADTAVGTNASDASAPARGPASYSPLHLNRKSANALVDSVDIALGMSAKDVRESWGLPQVIEVAGRTQNGNLRWTYNQEVPTAAGYVTQRKTIVFRNGYVVGWTTTSDEN